MTFKYLIVRVSHLVRVFYYYFVLPKTWHRQIWFHPSCRLIYNVKTISHQHHISLKIERNITLTASICQHGRHRTTPLSIIGGSLHITHTDTHGRVHDMTSVRAHVASPGRALTVCPGSRAFMWSSLTLEKFDGLTISATATSADTSMDVICVDDRLLLELLNHWYALSEVKRSVWLSLYLFVRTLYEHTMHIPTYMIRYS